MKKNVWNRIKLFTLAGAMSLALLGCGGTGGTKEGDPVQEEQPEDLNSNDKESPDSEEEQPKAQGGGTPSRRNRRITQVRRMKNPP